MCIRDRLNDRIVMLCEEVNDTTASLVVACLLYTSLRLEAQISLFTGSPIRFAIYAARMLPKFPVGTQILIFSPISTAPPLTISQ